MRFRNQRNCRVSELLNKPAFALVEVVLALGIAAFTLTAILGLLALAANSGKDATDDTLVATMANDVVASLRQQPFDTVRSTLSASPKAYFDVTGKRRTDSNGQDLSAPDALAIYQCIQSVQDDAATTSSDGTVNLMRLTLKFAWPAKAATPPNTRTINASLARY